MMEEIGSLIDGICLKGENRKLLKVRNPFNEDLVGVVHFGTVEDMEQAVQTANTTFHQIMKTMPAYKRSEILRKSADLLEIQAQSFVELLSKEAGKPIRDAQGEVRRAIEVLRFAAEEALKNNGELIKMDAAQAGVGRIGLAVKKPVGVIAAITPFNFPLNLVLHKIAPAIAAGCTVVLKPAEKTPFSAMKLVILMQEAGLPKGVVSVVNGEGELLVPPLVKHKDIKYVTFTGSGEIGLKIKEMAGNKKVTLELGSNSPTIVFQDADIKKVVAAVVKGGFAFAGQACISVQRLYVQKEIYKEVKEELVSAVKALIVGDPAKETTDVGPLITEDAAWRAEEWIQEAVAEGAVCLTGGKRINSVIEPTILENVTATMKVVCKEVFAPIVTLLPFQTEEEVLEAANDSDYGLQAGVFTNDINRAYRMFEKLETGGVWINDVSTYRQDNIPYGGVKKSGIVLEGVHYTMEEMMKVKFLGFNIG
ncbi:MAG: aldehyde dehydrogenase family protein [Bacillus sp. (in: firmicutes)]